MTTLSHSFAVRLATLDDGGAVGTLFTQLGYPAAADMMRCRLTNIVRDPAHRLFIAEDLDGRILGCVHVFFCPLLEADGAVQIGGLIVDPSCRRRGVGRLLMASAESWAAEAGCRQLYLRSSLCRTDAHAFYTRLGYVNLKTQYAFRKQL